MSKIEQLLERKNAEHFNDRHNKNDLRQSVFRFHKPCENLNLQKNSVINHNSA